MQLRMATEVALAAKVLVFFSVSFVSSQEEKALIPSADDWRGGVGQEEAKFFKNPTALAVGVSVLLTGCNDELNHEEIIASEKTLPANFYELAYERDSPPFFQFLIKKAGNQLEFSQLWSLYGFENKIPDVNFDEREVFFIGVQESGNCAFVIREVVISPDKSSMTLALEKPAKDCTTDATPRTFALQVEKEIMKELRNVVIIQNGIETTVNYSN